MTLYDLMNEHSTSNHSLTAKEGLTPELGKSLSLLHASLIECDLANEEQGGTSRLTANPKDIELTHLSHFIIAYLPFNSVTEKSEINHILFDVYSFFDWLDKKKAGGLRTPAEFVVLRLFQPPIVVALPVAARGQIRGVDSCGYALMA